MRRLRTVVSVTSSIDRGLDHVGAGRRAAAVPRSAGTGEQVLEEVTHRRLLLAQAAVPLHGRPEWQAAVIPPHRTVDVQTIAAQCATAMQIAAMPPWRIRALLDSEAP